MLSGLPHQEDRSQRGCRYRKYQRYWPWKRPLVAPELGISRAEADVLADVFRGGPPCPLVFSLSTRNVSTRRKLYAKAGCRGPVSRPKATKCYSLTAWQLTFLLYASDQQYSEAPKGSLLGVDREGAAGHFPEAARRHRELRMVGLSSFRPQLSRSGYSFTTSICLSITCPVNRSIATCTQ